ncbi:MAG: hypothetical protein Q7T80_06515 [Methanoregula sp.]|nr:hypothetical protein [Methanoregula sp.]
MKRGLAVLDAIFSDNAATVEKANTNAGRIWNLYGIIARKGDNTAEHPHRRSRIISVPDRLDPVSLDLLKKPVHGIASGCHCIDGISSGNKGV